MHEADFNTLDLDKNLEATVLSLVTDQLRDVFSTLTPEFFAPEDESADAGNQLLSDWAKDADLASILGEAGYYEDEWSDSSNKLLQIGLMTPHYLTSTKQNNSGQGDYRSHVREAIDYNERLRQTIEANPTIGARDLATYLQGAAMINESSPIYMKKAENQINSVINGARSELNFKYIVSSESMKENGVFYEDATAEDDYRGIDCRVKVFLGKDNERTQVILPVDIKSTIKQVSDLVKSGNVRPYGIKNGSIVLWSGVNLSDLGNRLMVDTTTAEAKAEPMLKILRLAATEYYDMVKRGQIRADLGGFASRVA